MTMMVSVKMIMLMFYIVLLKGQIQDFCLAGLQFVKN